MSDAHKRLQLVRVSPNYRTHRVPLPLLRDSADDQDPVLLQTTQILYGLWTSIRVNIPTFQPLHPIESHLSLGYYHPESDLDALEPNVLHMTVEFPAINDDGDQVHPNLFILGGNLFIDTGSLTPEFDPIMQIPTTNSTVESYDTVLQKQLQSMASLPEEMSQDRFSVLVEMVSLTGNVTSAAMYCKAQLYHAVANEYISEEFHFDFNPVLKERAVFLFNCAKSAIFSMNGKRQSIYLIVTIEQSLLCGSIEMEGQRKYSEIDVSFLHRHVREPIAMAAIPVFHEDGTCALTPDRKINVFCDLRSYPSATPALLCKDGIPWGHKLKKLILTLDGCDLDESRFPVGIVRVDPNYNTVVLNPAFAVEEAGEVSQQHGGNIIREVQDISSNSRMHIPKCVYVNSLYIRPLSFQLNSIMGLSSKTQVVVSIQVKKDDSDEGTIDCIFGQSKDPSLVGIAFTPLVLRKGSANIYEFQTTIKVDMPLVLTSKHHLLFTVYTCQVDSSSGIAVSSVADNQQESPKTPKGRFMSFRLFDSGETASPRTLGLDPKCPTVKLTPLGFSVVPLYHGGVPLNDGSHHTQIYGGDLPSDYLTAIALQPPAVGMSEIHTFLLSTVFSRVHKINAFMEGFREYHAHGTCSSCILPTQDLHSLSVQSMLNKLPSILNVLLDLLTIFGDTGAYAFDSFIDIITRLSSAINQNAAIPSRSELKKPGAVLDWYMKYIFNKVLCRDRLFFEELCFRWIEKLQARGEDLAGNVLLSANTLFSLLRKSMGLRASATTDLSPPQNHAIDLANFDPIIASRRLKTDGSYTEEQLGESLFSERFVRLLLTLCCELSNTFDPLLKTDVDMVKGLNLTISLFVRDLFLFMETSSAYLVAELYYQKLTQFHELRLEYVHILAQSPLYLEMNQPVWLRADAFKEIFVSLKTNRGEDGYCQHTMASIMLFELERALITDANPDLQISIIRTIKSVIMKHDVDAGTSGEEKGQLALMYTRLLWLPILPESRENRRDLFLCILWVLKNTPRTNLASIFKEKLSSSASLRAFFGLLQSCLFAFAQLDKFASRVRENSLVGNNPESIAEIPTTPERNTGPRAPDQGTFEKYVAVETCLIVLGALQVFLHRVSTRSTLSFLDYTLDILLAVMQLEPVILVLNQAIICWRLLIPYFGADIFKKVKGQERLRQSAVEMLRLCNHKDPQLRAKAVSVIYVLAKQNYSTAGSTQIFNASCKVALLQHVFVTVLKDFQRMEVSVACGLRYACQRLISDADNKMCYDAISNLFLDLQMIIGKASELVKLWSCSKDISTVTMSYHRFYLECCECYPDLDLQWIEDSVLHQHDQSAQLQRKNSFSADSDGWLSRRVNVLPCIRLGFRLLLRHEMSKNLHAPKAGPDGNIARHKRSTSGGDSDHQKSLTNDRPLSDRIQPSALAEAGQHPVLDEDDVPKSRSRFGHRRAISNTSSEGSEKCGGAAMDDGIDWTPSVSMCENTANSTPFGFKAYYPGPFKALRQKWGYNNSEYLLSMSSANYLSEWKNPGGKSGSLMLSSADKRLVVKSMSAEESRLLREMMRGYYQHMSDYSNTLLIRFLGLYSFKHQQQPRIHFIVMENVMLTNLEIHEKYDLKGSRVGRLAKLPEDSGAKTILKDMNVKENFHFGEEGRQVFLTQLAADTMLLLQHDIMDYSLLLGVHRAPIYDPFQRSIAKEEDDIPASAKAARMHRGAPSYFRNYDGGFLGRPIPPPSNAAADPSIPWEGGRPPIAYQSVYFVGVIDILQQYNLRKQMEYSFKGLIYEKEDLSVQEPNAYRDRFLKFLSEHVD